MDKKKTLILIKNYLLVALGTCLLAFGSVIFLTKCELVAGGVSGIAIIIQHFVPDHQIYDYVVASLQVFFFIIGLIFVGKSFAIRSAFASLLYILFTFLFKRVPVFLNLASEFAGANEIGNWIICGIFGGVFMGAGVAITLIGGGSTGGVDCFQPMFRNLFNIKESITSFVADAIVILIGMITMKKFSNALCGILCTFIASVMIEWIFIKRQTSYKIEVISSKWEEINKFVITDLERTTTIVDAKGAYTGEERKVLHIIIDKSQYEKTREFIALIDPNAFVCFTQTNAVYGEGFKANKNKKKVNNEENK